MKDVEIEVEVHRPGSKYPKDAGWSVYVQENIQGGRHRAIKNCTSTDRVIYVLFYETLKDWELDKDVIRAAAVDFHYMVRHMPENMKFFKGFLSFPREKEEKE